MTPRWSLGRKSPVPTDALSMVQWVRKLVRDTVKMKEMNTAYGPHMLRSLEKDYKPQIKIKKRMRGEISA